jgi:hypothetical protein
MVESHRLVQVIQQNSQRHNRSKSNDIKKIEQKNEKTNEPRLKYVKSPLKNDEKAVSKSEYRSPRDMSMVKCFRCNKLGHIALKCPTQRSKL